LISLRAEIADDGNRSDAPAPHFYLHRPAPAHLQLNSLIRQFSRNSFSMHTQDCNFGLKMQSSDMKRKRSMIIFGMILLELLAATTGYSGSYTLVKKTESIALYERWIQISGAEKARELKVVFSARTDASKIVAVLKDPALGRAWNQNVKEYAIRQEPGQTGWTSYIRYGIPWPIGDQDCCLSYSIRVTGQNTELFFESTQHVLFPQQKNAARISGVKGKWLLEAHGNGSVKVTYTISSDKNRQLPKWITDPVIHKNMISNITAFIRIIEKP
jgi:hypothetical protein